MGIVLFYLMISCSSNHRSEENSLRTSVDSCLVNLYDGELLLDKIGICRSCHLAGPGPRFDAMTLTFNELSVLESSKISDYVFAKKHGGMFVKDYPESGQVIDSLSNCDKKNLIHLIKAAAKNTPVP